MSSEPVTRGLIDTNIVIHLAALDSTLLPDEMVISAVTLAELSAGPHHTDDPAERARRTSVLQHTEATFDPLPFDAEAARMYGMVCAAVLATGRTPRRRMADLMIASIGRQPGSVVHHQSRLLRRAGTPAHCRRGTAPRTDVRAGVMSAPRRESDRYCGRE